MPHTTKYSEKMLCIKPPVSLWDEDLKLKYLRSRDNGTSISFQLIDKIVQEAFPNITDEYFDKFVEIKEVPYGRYNSDPNHRGG